MEKQDIIIVCKDCSTEFVWNVAEQEFYAEHEFVQPLRCRDCRKARKTNNKNNK